MRSNSSGSTWTIVPEALIALAAAAAAAAAPALAPALIESPPRPQLFLRGYPECCRAEGLLGPAFTPGIRGQQDSREPHSWGFSSDSGLKPHKWGWLTFVVAAHDPA